MLQGAHLLPLPCPGKSTRATSTFQLEKNINSINSINSINLMCSPSLRSVAGIPIHLHWSKLSNAQRCSIDHSAVPVSVQVEKGLSEQQRIGQLLRGCSTKGPLCIWTKSKRVHSLCGMLIRFRDAEATWLPFSCILDAK